MSELKDNELDDVTGGAAEPPMPGPTGGVTYTCPNCKRTINASSHDTKVTCPYVNCRRTYKVENGKLKLIS